MKIMTDIAKFRAPGIILSALFLLLCFLLFVPVKPHQADPVYSRLRAELCGLEDALVVYLEDHPNVLSNILHGKTQKGFSAQAWKYGGLPSPRTIKERAGDFVDPWGHPVIVLIKQKRTKIRNFAVKVYSVGPNGVDEEMNGDDVYCDR